MIIKDVYCDNCGAKYYSSDRDRNKEPYWHRVCDVCFMPMKLENPYYKEQE